MISFSVNVDCANSLRGLKLSGQKSLNGSVGYMRFLQLFGAGEWRFRGNEGDKWELGHSDG